MPYQKECVHPNRFNTDAGMRNRQQLERSYVLIIIIIHTHIFFNSLYVGASFQKKASDLDMSSQWSIMKRRASILTGTTQTQHRRRHEKAIIYHHWYDIIHTHLINSLYVRASVQKKTNDLKMSLQWSPKKRSISILSSITQTEKQSDGHETTAEAILCYYYHHYSRSPHL